MTSTALLSALREIVGEASVIESSDAAAPYLVDWRGRYSGAALAIVKPATTDEVSRVVALCARNGLPVVPQGGNTGLVGGATPLADGNDIVVSLARMNRVRDVDPVNNTITVEAGCILQHVQAAAQSADRLFPLSLASQGSCEIGGNLSTNAGGVHVLRYGNMRDLVLGLEVVLADGRVWNGLRALRKDNTGYDLKHLFIGAEGTLGVITAAVLKLFARPRVSVVCWLAIESVARAVELPVRASRAIRRTGQRLRDRRMRRRWIWCCGTFPMREIHFRPRRDGSACSKFAIPSTDTTCGRQSKAS